jgi:hypothetical protein
MNRKLSFVAISLPCNLIPTLVMSRDLPITVSLLLSLAAGIPFLVLVTKVILIHRSDLAEPKLNQRKLTWAELFFLVTALLAQIALLLITEMNMRLAGSVFNREQLWILVCIIFLPVVCTSLLSLCFQARRANISPNILSKFKWYLTVALVLPSLIFSIFFFCDSAGWLTLISYSAALLCENYLFYEAADTFFGIE